MEPAVFNFLRPKVQRLVTDIQSIEDLLRGTRYATEIMPAKAAADVTYNRVRIHGLNLRVIILHQGNHLIFLENYCLNGRFSVESMQQWNFGKQFASYTYLAELDRAALKHTMLCSFGVPERTFLYFLETWRDLAEHFRRHCGVSVADRI